jgi:alginate O-acetyltransferase complex protein AlgI
VTAANRTVAFAALGFLLCTAVLFYGPAYRPLLDPASTTGSFERTVASFQQLKTDRRRDVLVLGDSRIYSGLDPMAASHASRLRFLNGGIPGTTPRCWYFFVRAIDEHANRFKAVVIPVDSYADDDSAIGSLDAATRRMDLRYIVFRVEPFEIPSLIAPLGDARDRLAIGTDLLLRGPELRDDVQSLVSGPVARLHAIEAANASQTANPTSAHARTTTLAGLRVDFFRKTIAYPRGVGLDERGAIRVQVFPPTAADPAYGAYRRRWLGAILARYRATGTPVIFVRIPTRPAHSANAGVLGDSLRQLARDGARLLNAGRYIDLERASLFADADHLNQRGSQLFSVLLGRDVARRIGNEPPRPDTRGAMPVEKQRAKQTEGIARLRAAIGIGIPLPLQSYEFWLFVAIVAAAFYAVPATGRRFVLLSASYYFYARWNGWYVVFLAVLTISDYWIGLMLGARPKRLVLTAGIAANLAFLGTFKYLNFGSSTVAELLGMHRDPWLVNLIVPIGISFHTFQSISYLVDVYRGKIQPTRSLPDYALYLAFFPQLLAGPIVRAGLFLGELLHWRKPSADDVSYGCARIAFGLLKKICIADQFAQIADSYFGGVRQHPGALAAASGTFAFAMQIYFDFSGYSDIAIGAARLFGFVFPENFSQPYLSISITDFWHRWHITLSTWLRDYLYIPLGGNRSGTWHTLRNLMLTMVLGGLWHGAAWTFVAWGAYHGALLSLERLAGLNGRERRGGWRYVTRVAVTFCLVCLGWVLFRSPTFAVASAAYRQLFFGGWIGGLLNPWQLVLIAGIVAYGLVTVAARRYTLGLVWTAIPMPVRAAGLCAALLSLELLSWSGTPSTFVYFKF